MICSSSSLLLERKKLIKIHYQKLLVIDILFLRRQFNHSEKEQIEINSVISTIAVLVSHPLHMVHSVVGWLLSAEEEEDDDDDEELVSTFRFLVTFLSAEADNACWSTVN